MFSLEVKQVTMCNKAKCNLRSPVRQKVLKHRKKSFNEWLKEACLIKLLECSSRKVLHKNMSISSSSVSFSLFFPVSSSHLHNCPLSPSCVLCITEHRTRFKSKNLDYRVE